eukprot:Plantae.Rhodophyta-Hildenbrandia_rubra.ctg60134.p1 GENE.Plantae.Rhodophyta-Hildenbrandia_rubra.ctg60134~~Plantae.Rhodophyta-Hildenbrandia_rubra.ctg60134.p1  ORF type:complete len:283 (+),score=12.99 Plantae.Rhodophyta-Hildenbrandia_rubra.ctg60134:37-849(+)
MPHPTYYQQIMPSPPSSSDSDLSSASEHLYVSLASNSDIHAMLHIQEETTDLTTKKLFQWSHEISPRMPPNIRASKTFDGVCIDTGSPKTVIGLPQFIAYCNLASRPETVIIGPPTEKRYRFGLTVFPSIGTTRMRIPIDNHSFFEYNSDIVTHDAPALLGLFRMRSYGAHLDLENLTIYNDVWKLPMVIYKDHLYINVSYQTVLFTETELHKLNLQFGHPESSKLHNLMKRAEYDVNTEDLHKLKDIEGRVSLVKDISTTTPILCCNAK